MPLRRFFFSYKGRVNRKQYWGFLLFALVINVLVGAIETVPEAMLVIGSPALLFILFASFVVTVKRLHDLNLSGWWMLAALVPFLGGIGLLLVCGIVKGTKGENRYGHPPDRLF